MEPEDPISIFPLPSEIMERLDNSQPPPPYQVLSDDAHIGKDSGQQIEVSTEIWHNSSTFQQHESTENEITQARTDPSLGRLCPTPPEPYFDPWAVVRPATSNRGLGFRPIWSTWNLPERLQNPRPQSSSRKPRLGPKGGTRVRRLCRAIVTVYQASLRAIVGQPRPTLGYARGGTPLQCGDIELHVHPDNDWTKDWGWALRFRAYSKPESVGRSHWVTSGCILFENLPKLAYYPVMSWDDEHCRACPPARYQKDLYPYRRWNYSRALVFGQGRKWRGELLFQHRSSAWLVMSEFRDFLSAEQILIAEIDQRVGLGKYKTVVAYSRGVGYRNDLTGQAQEQWRQDMPEQFKIFIRNLLPHNPPVWGH